MLRYPWPASGLSHQDMQLLHNAREKARPRMPITRLIAEAVRRVHGQASYDSDLRKAPDLKVAA